MSPVPFGVPWPVDILKPEGFKDYLTLSELAELCNRHRRRITDHESKGNIPSPIRVKHGKHQVRLYSPQEVKTIVEFFKQMDKRGRWSTRWRS